MKPEGSSPRSQKPATCPYPEPHQFSPRPVSYFFKIHFNISFRLCLGLPIGLFPSGSPHQNLRAPRISFFLIWITPKYLMSSTVS
jgi:hypothetical protein